MFSDLPSTLLMLRNAQPPSKLYLWGRRYRRALDLQVQIWLPSLGLHVGITIRLAEMLSSMLRVSCPFLGTTHRSLTSSRSLNPGGWIEIQDFNPLIEDNDNSFPANCAVRKWTELSIEAANKLGRPLDSPAWYKAYIEEVGFQNVVEKFKLPQNKWPKDPMMKELGRTS